MTRWWVGCALLGLAACDDGGGGDGGGAGSGVGGGVDVGGSSGGAGGEPEAPDAGASGGQDGGAPCDCPGRQRCEAGACVEPAQCMGHEDCRAPRACVEGACRDACAGDGDCPRALRCDLQTRDCVEADPCGSDQACFEGRVCRAGACGGPDEGCDGDEDCMPGEACRGEACVNPGCAEVCPGAQRCIDGECLEPPVCGDDVDCLGGRVCVDGACADPCQCAGDQSCDQPTGRCAEQAPCAADAGCFEGRRCADGVCVEACAEAADCPGAQRCEDGECREPEVCARDVDCAAGRVCDAGACRDGCARAGCPGALECNAAGGCDEASPCRDDAGCRAGRRCTSGVCDAPCRDAADCDGAQQCMNGDCVDPPRCFMDADCGPGRVCSEDLRCTSACDAARPCAGTLECADGACVEGAACAADRDCLGGRRCHPDAGVCVDVCVEGGCLGGQVCGGDGLCREAGGCDDDAMCLGERQCVFGECRNVRCRADGECPAGERCVDFACAVEAPCDCVAGWACDAGRCVAPGPCDGAADCGGAACVDQRCGRCAGNEDCPGSTTCDAGGCVEGALCVADAGCLPGRVCEAGGFCAPDFDGCPDDALDNRSADQATPLGLGTYSGLRLCESADDWFRFASETPLRVLVRGDAGRPAASLSLYRIADPFSAFETDPGYAGESWIAAPAGEYLARVSAPRGGAGAYTLDLRAVGCDDDRYERPWRNDDRARAAPVDAGTHRATICGDESDWFVYRGAGAARLRVEGGVVPQARDLAPGDAFEVTGDAGARYSVTIEAVRDPLGRCEEAEEIRDDASFDDGPDDFIDGCLGGPGRPDRVFRVVLREPGTVNARIEGPIPMVAMALYEACDDAPLACTGGAGGIRASDLAAGTYYLVLDGPIQGRLRVDVEAGFACEDAPVVDGEADITLDSANDALPGGCIGGGNNAVYRFTVDQPSAVTVSARGAAQLAVAIRRVCDDALDEVACGVGFNAVARAAALEAGEYYAVVAGDGAASLTVAAEPVGPSADLVESCAGAPERVVRAGDRLVLEGDTSAAGDHVDATACNREAGGRDLVLRFRLDAAARVEASLVADTFDGYLMLTAADCAGDVVCGTAFNPFLAEDLAAGSYALVIDGQSAGQSGPFRLNVNVR